MTENDILNELRFEDENEELNALTLTTLLNSGVEEALSNLSPAQLIRLEKNVQKLKRQKTPNSAANVTSTLGLEDGVLKQQMGGGESSGVSSIRKRRVSDGEGSIASVSTVSERSRPTGGQYMNLPASTPHVEFREGMEWLIFTYSTKGHIQEYHIRADIDDINVEDIPDDFKIENCVYPRALVPREAYVGNRYDYETVVNEIAWRLCWRNPGVLNAKRGLIQRAVDSYRNRTSENRSRRVMRQEKLHSQNIYGKRGAGLLDDGHGDGSDIGFGGSSGLSMIRVPGPKTLTLNHVDSEGKPCKIKIRVDVEGVDLSLVDEEFRAANAVYPQAMSPIGEDLGVNGSGLGGSNPNPYGPDHNDRWEYENACNELAWKLAWLNGSKLGGKRDLLARAVEAYHARMEAAERARQAVLHHHQHIAVDGVYDPAAAAAAAMMYHHHHHPLHQQHIVDGVHYDDAMIHHHVHHGSGGGLLDKNEEFSQMVAHTLQQAIAQGVVPAHEAAGFQHSLQQHHVATSQYAASNGVEPYGAYIQPHHLHGEDPSQQYHHSMYAVHHQMQQPMQHQMHHAYHHHHVGDSPASPRQDQQRHAEVADNDHGPNDVVSHPDGEENAPQTLSTSELLHSL